MTSGTRDKPGPARVRHVAIIADGNRRWARARGLPILAGHLAGVDSAWALVRDALDFRVKELVMFAFSTENWRRPADEVEALLELCAERIVPEVRRIGAHGVRVRFIGSDAPMPESLLRDMRAAERITESKRTMKLFIAFNYGGRAELLHAAERFKGGGERELRKLMYAPDMHDPDLLIRTGGDKRLSNFLLWQSAYTELVFRDELFPDFRRPAFEESLAELGRRRPGFHGR